MDGRDAGDGDIERKARERSECTAAFTVIAGPDRSGSAGCAADGTGVAANAETRTVTATATSPNRDKRACSFPTWQLSHARNPAVPGTANHSLAGSLTDRLAGSLTQSPTGSRTDRLAGWLAQSPTGPLTERPTHRLAPQARSSPIIVILLPKRTDMSD